MTGFFIGTCVFQKIGDLDKDFFSRVGSNVQFPNFRDFRGLLMGMNEKNDSLCTVLVQSVDSPSTYYNTVTVQYRDIEQNLTLE